MTGVLERKVFASDQFIFHEGDYGNVAYIIQSGLVEIIKIKDDGKEIVLGSIGKGGVFGEMALIDDRPRMASARAVEPTTVIVVSRITFDAKVKKADPFLKGLIKVLASNLREVGGRVS